MPKSTVKKPLKINPSPSSAASGSKILIGLFQCYNFLSFNEYSDKTIGLLAFLLRISVGEINFSDIFDEVIQHNQQEQVAVVIALLEKKRNYLQEIDASIEKCLMISRLITRIQEDERRFAAIISHIQTEMTTRMRDNQGNQIIKYPEDFRQREKDFHRRRDVQNVRRLFYSSPAEVEAPSLIHLQNRTTEHLNYLIESKMRFDPNFRDTGLGEIETIFSTSFMIIAQPHSGFNPVVVYDRKGFLYTAKTSVIIVSLLHDFMQTHPDMIKLDDIVPTLLPSSKLYKLDGDQNISWKTCQLQIRPNEKPQTILYAELKSIIIKQTTSANTPLHLSENLHSLIFSIQFNVNITEHHISKTYRIPLESLPFAIATNNCHISYLSTKVMIDDIRRFSQANDVKIISNFVQRYFIHRTGVEPKKDLRTYLEEELTKAKNKKANCQSLEDIYMDFLVQFVHQVEFMAKYPILAMFYADGLFLGPCNSKRAAEVMKQSSDVNPLIVGLRWNSINIDSESTASTTASSKSMKLATPCVRVDMYNARTKMFQNYTFDSVVFISDIYKFVCTANVERASSIQVLFNFDDINGKNYKSYQDFAKYYHDRLHEICKTDSEYKHIINLLLHIEDNGDTLPFNGSQNMNSSNLSLNNLDSIFPMFMATTNDESDNNETSDSTYIPLPDDLFSTNKAPSPNGFSRSNPQPLQFANNDDLIQQLVSNPDLCTKIVTLINNLRISTVTEPVQQQQSQISYWNQQQPQILNPNQQQVSSVPVQMYPQSCPQILHTQQQQFNQHQQLPAHVVHSQPMNTNQCQPHTVFPSNGIHTLSQYSTQNQYFQLSNDNFVPSNPSFDESDMTDQISSNTTNGDSCQWSTDIFEQ